MKKFGGSVWNIKFDRPILKEQGESACIDKLIEIIKEK